MKRKFDLLAEIRRACLRETRATVAENLKLNAISLPNHVYSVTMFAANLAARIVCFGASVLRSSVERAKNARAGLQVFLIRSAVELICTHGRYIFQRIIDD